jgi:hypothetical protein
MDGQVFPRARVIERQLRKVAKRRSGNGPAFQANPSFA